MEKFVISKDIVKKSHRFNTSARSLEFKIRPVPQNENPVAWIKDAINQIVQEGTKELEPSDKVGFTFCSKDFSRGQGWMPFKTVSDVTFDDIYETISSIYQSNTTGLNTESFCLGVTSVKMPIGTGRGRKDNTYEEECKGRRGIVAIKNKDNMCLPRALVVTKANVDKDPNYPAIRKDRGKEQLRRAEKLCQEADVSINETGAGIPELQKFQEFLTEYKIIVYNYGAKGRDVIYEGSQPGKHLNLLYNNGHYNAIISLTAAFACSYYCEDCHVPYNNKHGHMCGGTCSACQQPPRCSDDQPKIQCARCNRYFRGDACYNNHLKDKSYNNSKTVCDALRGCINCMKTVKNNRKHTCGEIFCKICQQHQPSDHLCYIQPDIMSPPSKDFLFIFYDLETRQETVFQDASLLHEPNLCVFNQRCYNCIREKNLYFCQSCGFRQTILKDGDVISAFMKHVLQSRKRFKNVVVLAHNGGGFDHQFILNYILTKTDVTPDLIMRGTKLISMAVDNVRFLDSLNYFPMPLSKLPKSFGFTELKKGYFPHLFNIIDHQDYVGPMPAFEYYDPNAMKDEKTKEELIKWYNDRVAQNYIFDFIKELIEYCISDVDILTHSCLQFREMMITETNVCPFMEAVTIASACNKVYRRNFLKPNTIGIIPRGGYRWRNNQSKIAIQWLIWEERRRNISIRHAAKNKEVMIHGVKVDGYSEDTKEIFEFEGCYYHGCPKCFTEQRDSPIKDDPSETLNLRREATRAKINKLRSFGYKVVEMWECEFRRLLGDTKEMKEYTENHPLILQTPLEPRDAFYGGRTGNIFEYYATETNEKIKYVDVCSLYPYACKYGRFPVGHPKVFVGEECPPLTSVSGLVKCKVLPPRDLYHPVLPVKMNSKLMFLLCRTCGQNFNSEECLHSDEERALSGVWVIDEVIKAIEMGYEIIETVEVWAYETVQFGKNVQGLFTDMMNKFIKIKQESSNWPANCQTSQEKNEYIEKFLQREDVLLDFSKIVDNPGLRSLAKLMLNSFWGKFGQRENQAKTSIINQPSEFFNIMSNPSIFVNTVLPVNEDTLIVNWEYREEACNSLATVNVVIAAYVTAHARLKLYSYLEKLGEQVLYYDTDSVIYVSRPGKYEVPTGEFIGDMTDELEKEGIGSYITEFVSGGPKNYAYKMWSTKQQKEKIECKVKGISLTIDTKEKINFNSIKEMVLNRSDPIYISSKQIRRTLEHQVVTVPCKKKYQINSLKRKFLPDHSSIPYGYKKLKL